MKLRQFPLAAAAAWLALGPASVRASDTRAKLIVPQGESETIHGLTLDPLEIAVEDDSGTQLEKARAFVRIRGKFERPGWNLVGNGKQFILKADPKETGARDFEYKVYLQGESTPVELYAFDPVSLYEQEKVEIRFDSYKQWNEAAEADLKKRRDEEAERKREEREEKRKVTALTFLLGVANVRYQEEQLPDYTMTALMPEAQIERVLIPYSLDFTISGFITALPFSTSQSGVTATFYGGNVRFDYTPGEATDNFRWSLGLGAYYNTMTVTGNAFGFSNMMGPLFSTGIEWLAAGRNSFTAYAGFSPTSAGTNVFPIFNHEVSCGAGWVIRTAEGRAIPIVFDYSVLQLHIRGVNIQNTATSLRIGYSL